MVMTPAQFIDEKDARKIADAVGMDVGSIRVWKHRQVIPRTYWPELVKALDGVSLDDLLEVEAAGKAAKGDGSGQDAAA